MAQQKGDGTLYETINADAEELRGALTARRRDFHRYAETGWLEMRTASIIAKELTVLGYEVLTGKAVCAGEARMGLPSEEALEAHYAWAEANGADAQFLPGTQGGYTGVIGILRCGEGPCVALRFDIDALGVVESATDAHRPAREGYASVEPGVMHACGHDGHAAIGLGVARVLVQQREKLCGTVKLIFQPAEEGVCGAKSIVEMGHLDGVDYVLAGHIFPAGKAAGFELGVLKEDGEGGLATTKLDATFLGKPAHAGIAPQAGKNALLAAATAVLNLHAIPRFGNVPTQLNVGVLHAGSGRNVVCEKATLELEVRGQTSEANDYMDAYARRIVASAAAMHACACQVRAMGSAAALRCDWPLSKRVLDVCTEKLGMKALALPTLSGGSEDFSYMAERVRQQGGQATYFVILASCPAANHNDRFDFDEEALVNGVRAFCGTVLELMGKKRVQAP